jgi:hypothetical protein
MKKTHGHTRGGHTPTYVAWLNMRRRCDNPNALGYESYGAGTLTVCARWLKFENFLADMGERPERLSLDRKDNDLGYSPENCRWATTKEQLANRRVTIWIEIDGDRRTLSDWCRHFGIKYFTALYRIRNGWDLTDAVRQPARHITRSKLLENPE